jgi:hypothetical protein
MIRDYPLVSGKRSRLSFEQIKEQKMPGKRDYSQPGMNGRHKKNQRRDLSAVFPPRSLTPF